MRRDIIRRRMALEREVRREDADLKFKLGVIARARSESARLLEQEEWVAFLEQIAALNERDQTALDGLLSMSDTGSYMTPEQCQAIEYQRAILNSKIQARNECIEIPKTILHGTASSSD